MRTWERGYVTVAPPARAASLAARRRAGSVPRGAIVIADVTRRAAAKIVEIYPLESAGYDPQSSAGPPRSAAAGPMWLLMRRAGDSSSGGPSSGGPSSGAPAAGSQQRG